MVLCPRCSYAAMRRRPATRGSSGHIVLSHASTHTQREKNWGLFGIRIYAMHGIYLLYAPPLHHVTSCCINRFQVAFPYRQTKVRRRKDDPGVGTTASRIVA